MSNSVVKLLQNILITDHKCEGVIPLECSVFPTKVIKIVQPGSIPVTIVTPGAGCGTISPLALQFTLHYIAPHPHSPYLSSLVFLKCWDIILNTVTTLPLIIPIHDTPHDGLSAVSHPHIILIMFTQAITAIYWQPESLELIIKMIPAFSAII